MTELKHLTDDQLEQSVLKAVSNETAAITRVLHHLCEVQRRRLFSRRDCDSLFSYCTKVLKYSEREASHRVNAARAMREFPELEESLQSGTLNLTSISQAQTFFNQEAKLREKPLSKEEKKEVLEKLGTKSTRETERILLSLSSAPEKTIKERVKPISEQFTEVRFAADEETMQHLNRLREVWSHAMPGASLAEIVKRMAKDCCERHDPMLKAKRAEERSVRSNKTEVTAARLETPSQCSSVQLSRQSGLPLNRHSSPPFQQSKTRVNRSKQSACTQIDAKAQSQQARSQAKGAVTTRSRVIPSAVRHAVWRRDGGVCQFVDLRTGRRCGSRRFLELDHVHSFALGGENTVENLRLRCRTHNGLAAELKFGRHFMERYRS